MTPLKYQQAIQSVNAQAIKVLEVIPLHEAWTVSQIIAELSRLQRSNDPRVVQACLQQLFDAGLVKMTGPGHSLYQRVEPRKPVITPAPEVRTVYPITGAMQQAFEAVQSKADNSVWMEGQSPLPAKTPAPPPADQAIALLGSLAERARTLSVDMKVLAGDIDDAALRIAESMQSSDKLEQLRKLLKELGT